jgi:hypothetical protein
MRASRAHQHPAGPTPKALIAEPATCRLAAGAPRNRSHKLPACVLRKTASWQLAATLFSALLFAEPVDTSSLFDEVVAPVLAANCLECHRGAEPKGKLDLSRRASALLGGKSGPALAAGDPEKSLLWQRIVKEEMPPKHPLGEKERKVLHDWIAGGAHWGSDPIDPFRYTSSKRAGYDWWSLQPLGKPDVPKSDAGSWARNEIDRFVAARLKANGLSPSPRASPRALVRRLYYVLHGLPAPPEVVQKFAEDSSSERWKELVDGLLASPHYGERWARHWLDVARFGESDGYEYNNARKNAWHYRDWVIRSLNNDLPYDQFVRMQIAGDILKPNSLEGAAAVGFLVAGVHNKVLGKSPAMKAAGRHEELEEIAGTVGQSFLGLTVNCARCHDHKFDPITTREYYSFIAALDGVTHGERRLPVLNKHAARRNLLQKNRNSLHRQLLDSFTARKGEISTSANQLMLRHPIAANEKGSKYRVSLKVAPTVWAGVGQATTERDGVVVRILRKDGTVLASKDLQPRPWEQGRNAGNYEAKSFIYVGDGSEDIRIKLSPFPLGSRRFGGAVDDLTVEEVGGKVFLNESFDDLQQLSAPGFQAHTRRRVFYGGTSKRWEHSGRNAIHAEERAEGNLALQVFAGKVTGKVAKAETVEEKKLQKEIDALDSEIKKLTGGAGSRLYSVVPKPPGAMRIMKRGDVTRPGEEVSAGGIAAVKMVKASFGLNTKAPDRERRAGLVKWITDPNNGPFHRVVVNRVWHYHFGRGIVPSPNDFGFNGGRPSHPELLEWLACWFRENGYSLKELHRLILTSATWQQSSNPVDNSGRENAETTDKSNRLLWRQNPRRVDAETLRDSLLDVAGVLNRKQFGPGYEDVKRVAVPPANYWVAIDPIGPEFNRRTIYRWQARGQRSALLETFDCPDPSTTTPVRSVTTTPSQALSQWNHPFVLRMSEHLANRVKKEATPTLGKQVDRMWQLVMGRPPHEEEKSEAVALVKKIGLELLARVLFNSNEWIWIE